MNLQLHRITLTNYTVQWTYNYTALLWLTRLYDELAITQHYFDQLDCTTHNYTALLWLITLYNELTTTQHYFDT